jgi:hypothetical protein
LVKEATSGEDGRTRIVVRQPQGGGPYRLDVELELRWEGGSRRERIVLEEAEVVLDVQTPRPLEAIEIDPDAWLLHELGISGRADAAAGIEPPGPVRAYNPEETALAGAG